MKYLDKVKRLIRKFDELNERYAAGAPRIYAFHYAYLSRMYGISPKIYFENKLYDSSVDNSAFWSTQHRVIHRWSNVVKKYKPDASKWWLFVRRVDYLWCKLRYPGLDAMDYFRYEFYSIKHCKRKTFITEGYLGKMDNYFNGGRDRAEAREILSDKRKFNTVFSAFIARKWLDTRVMTYDAFENFCALVDKAIVKPANGTQGMDVSFADLSAEEERTRVFERFHGEDYIMEELIRQNDVLHALNPSSVNTLRVYSVCQNGEVEITGATLRIGNGLSGTDNYSSGGMAAEIDVETGVVISRAISQDGSSYYIHPASQKVIIGTQIPCWEKVKETVKSAHKLISELGYVGWDVVVCEDYSITFIEANTFGEVELQQHPAMVGKKEIYSSYMR